MKDVVTPKLPRIFRNGIGLVVLLAAACAQEPAAPGEGGVPILALMVDVVTPATNTLRTAEAPLTESDWAELADAAQLIIRAFRQIKEGGTGPNDTEWVADPRWQAYSETLLSATRRAQDAIERRDLPAFQNAERQVYDLCEACHVDFHPNADPEMP